MANRKGRFSQTLQRTRNTLVEQCQCRPASRRSGSSRLHRSLRGKKRRDAEIIHLELEGSWSKSPMFPVKEKKVR